MRVEEKLGLKSLFFCCVQILDMVGYAQEEVVDQKCRMKYPCTKAGRVELCMRIKE